MNAKRTNIHTGLTSDTTPQDEVVKNVTWDKPRKEFRYESFNPKEETVAFISNCTSCNAPTKTKMVIQTNMNE